MVVSAITDTSGGVDAFKLPRLLTPTLTSRDIMQGNTVESRRLRLPIPSAKNLGMSLKYVRIGLMLLAREQY
jgi:hypothetical protein